MNSANVELLNLTEYEYRALPGVNWSHLKHMAISPAQYKWEIDNPRSPSKEMSLGTIEHLAMLQPDEFYHRRRMSKSNRGTKAFEKEENLPENEGCVLITEAEDQMIRLHSERYVTNEHHDQITKDSKVEQCLMWTDIDTGIVCKCRPDMFNDLTLVDIKTNRHIDERRWWYDFRDYKYHCQFAFYHDALQLLDGIDRVCMAVKLETSPCYDVLYYPLPDIAITEGRAHYRRLLNDLRDCLEVDAWPGKCNELAPVNFSNWNIEKSE